MSSIRYKLVVIRVNINPDNPTHRWLVTREVGGAISPYERTIDPDPVIAVVLFKKSPAPK